MPTTTTVSNASTEYSYTRNRVSEDHTSTSSNNGNNIPLKTVISVNSDITTAMTMQDLHSPPFPDDPGGLLVKPPVVRTSSNRSGANHPHAAKVEKLGHRRVFDDGEITYKKFETTELMGSIQLGIQQSVGSLASVPYRDLLMQDFEPIETVMFNKDGNKTPAHNYAEFRFRTYAPLAFRTFRKMFEIDQELFLMSLCSTPMRELANPGASGSIFYLTSDDNFIVKTVQHKEAEFLQEFIPGYYLNLQQNKRTLLPKFFGLYCYSCNAKNVRIVIMNNLLPTGLKMHHRFDLKGSTYKRKANHQERSKNNPTYKDLDFLEFFPEGIYLKPDIYDNLMNSILRDCRVLESFKIMDYSLLIGIHNLDQALREEKEGGSIGKPGGDVPEDVSTSAGGGPSTEHHHSELERQGSFQHRSERIMAHSTALESITMELESVNDALPGDLHSGIKGNWGGIPAKNHRGENLLLFIGIIDILQEYGMFKKVEHYWKSLIHDGDTVSVHRPGFYAKRFQTFMKEHVFKKVVPPPPTIGITAPAATKGLNSSFRRTHFRRTLSKETPTPAVSPTQGQQMQQGPSSSSDAKIQRGLSKQDSVTVIKIGEEINLPPVLQDRRLVKKEMTTTTTTTKEIVTVNKNLNTTPPHAPEDHETGSIITMTSDEKVQIYVPSPNSTPYNTITKMTSLSTITSSDHLWQRRQDETPTAPEMVKISINNTSPQDSSSFDKTITDLPSLPIDEENYPPTSLSDIQLEDKS